MKVKAAQKLRNTLLIVGFIIMLAGGSLSKVFGVVGAVVMFSSLIPHFLFNKCPHCDKQLGRNEGDFCHHCGGKIE